MKIDRWRQIEGLLDAALDEREPTQRALLLDRACAGDADLRAEVESLLAHHAPSENFIEAPAFAFTAELLTDDANDELENRHIGAYKIIREIGHGGMGAVYLAERADGAFEQQVALKIVRGSFADSELVRRFRRERQILASLNHPNISRLLDGGVSQNGEPFLAMEHVEGVRIDDYCDARRLSIDERLRLFLTVCQAVSYAHQHLIVHRDIKPSNILVTKDSVPKLLDFGIAKLLDAEHAAEHTQTELRAFTPDYASPEQVRGEQITTASDVYSLGALLEELLSDASNRKKAPLLFEQTTLPRKAAKTNLPAAETKENQRRTVKGRKPLSVELRRIVEMARREEPARRYASVAQFAEDIQRYLDGLPVRAQKDSFTYRASKFVQRHKAGVAAAALMLLTLVGGIVATAWQARRATQQARFASAQRDRAQRRFDDVRKLSNSLLFEITPKIERLEGSIEARETLVKRALEYLDSLAEEAGDDLQLQSELAAAYEKVGDLQGAPGKPNLSDFSGALASLEKAKAIRSQLFQKTPQDAENQKRLAANHNLSSYIRWWTSEVDGSIKDSEKALELYGKLIAEQPRSIELRTAAAESHINLAQTYYFNDQVTEVYPPLRNALGELEALRQTDAGNNEIGRLLGKGYVLLGLTLFWDNKPTEGETEVAKALALSESLVANNPNDNVLKQGLWHVYTQASQFYQDSNPQRSFDYLLRALKLAEESVNSDPVNTQARQNLAKTFSFLGLIAIKLKRLDGAASYLDKSLAVFTELERAEPHNLTYKDDIGRIYRDLGLTKYQQRDFPGALAAYQKAIEVFEFQGGDPKNLFPQRKLSNVFAYIGDVYRELAKAAGKEQSRQYLQAAKENYQRALDILLKLQSQNALAEYDHKVLEELQATLKLL
jgi:eukaryotic-like serine/threonine-protein kinase